MHMWGRRFTCVLPICFSVYFITPVWTIVDQVKMKKNNMELSFPHQLFIDNEFMDASNGDTYNTINPTDESVRHLGSLVVSISLSLSLSFSLSLFITPVLVIMASCNASIIMWYHQPHWWIYSSFWSFLYLCLHLWVPLSWSYPSLTVRTTPNGSMFISVVSPTPTPPPHPPAHSSISGGIFCDQVTIFSHLAWPWYKHVWLTGLKTPTTN